MNTSLNLFSGNAEAIPSKQSYYTLSHKSLNKRGLSKLILTIFFGFLLVGNQVQAQYLSNAYGNEQDNIFTVTKEAYDHYFSVGITAGQSTFSRINPFSGEADFTLLFSDDLMVKNFIPIDPAYAPTGDFIVVGRSKYAPNRLLEGGIVHVDLGIMLWRVRSDGSIVWSKEYTSVDGRPLQMLDHMMDLPIYQVENTIAIPTMIQDSDGGNTIDPVILFVDYDGIVVNSVTYDAPNDQVEHLYDVVYEPSTDGGKFILLGEYKDAANEWHNTISVLDNPIGRTDVMETPTNYQFAGVHKGKKVTFKRILPVYTNGYLNGYVVVGFYGDRFNHFITKFDANMNYQWAKKIKPTINGVEDANIRNLLQDSNGNIQLVGFHTNSEGTNTYRFRFSLNGFIDALQSDPQSDYYQPIISNTLSGKLLISGAVRNRFFIQDNEWDAYLLVADNDWAIYTSTGNHLLCSMKKLSVKPPDLGAFATEYPMSVDFTRANFVEKDIKPSIEMIYLAKNPTCSCWGV